MWFFVWGRRSNYSSATISALTSSFTTHLYAVFLWARLVMSSAAWQWVSEIVSPINFWFASSFPIGYSSIEASWASFSLASSPFRDLFSTLPMLTSRLPADSPKAWSCYLRTVVPLVSCCWTIQADFLRIRKYKDRARNTDWSPLMSSRWFGTSWLWLIHIASADQSQRCFTIRWSKVSASPLLTFSSSPFPWFPEAGSLTFSRISP